MDHQKRAMLYPEMDLADNESVREQRLSASAAMGLPLDSPPSYDMAVAPANSTSAAALDSPFPQQEATSSIDGRRSRSRVPVIVVPSNRSSPQMDSAPTAVGSSATLGPNPCAVLCPSCGSNITTRMRYTPNTRTHFFALLLCIVGWCCCACTVPYCMNSCRSRNHYCSKCNTFLGVWDPRKH